jgi:hypothetical protein
LCWWGASVMLQENRKSHYYPFLQLPAGYKLVWNSMEIKLFLNHKKSKKCGLVTRLCHWTAAFPVMNEWMPSRHPNSNKSRVVFISSFSSSWLKSRAQMQAFFSIPLWRSLCKLVRSQPQ